MRKEKYCIEYNLKTVSATVLWTYVGTINGLADWFADDAFCSGKNFTFVWNKSPQNATQTAFRAGAFIRFHWDEDEDDSKTYFEFRINQVELTGETILVITDFAYPDEKKDGIELWNNQIGSLKRILGV